MGNNVKRDEALIGFLTTVDIEGDPGPAKGMLGVARLAFQPLRVLPVKPVAVMKIGFARRVAVTEHLIERL